MGKQIPVKSPLNADAFASYLQDYWDWELVLLLKYGFPLGFNYDSEIKSDKINHKTAIQFPEHVSHYIQEELKHDALIGPFETCPFDKFHTSPFLTRDKSSSDKRRVIVDLSWPKGKAINDGISGQTYSGTEFILTYPTIDDVTAQV